MSLFGVPTSRSESHIVLVPVPWDATTSYGGGTSGGPQAILKASPQIDLFDIELGEAYRTGYHLETEDSYFVNENPQCRQWALKAINQWNEQGALDKDGEKAVNAVNQSCRKMVAKTKELCQSVLAEKKIAAVLGGDHSTPLGLISALSETQSEYGILHIDAHADLRKAYQGFEHSHASIMRNVMELPNPPARLVQVGIRDFCKEEFDFIQQNESRVKTFFDRNLKKDLMASETWDQLCQAIVKELPQKVYVSFDIDGLSPEFCPHTGTPVPGGLSFDQAIHLLFVLGHSGRKIIGFDLNEVTPGIDSEWDANVGSRILFKLCGWTAKTNGLI